MDTRKRGSTSEMQVTSIRLEPELKERLREVSGEQGYQSLIREVLWQFVDQQMVSDEVRWRSLSERESYSVEDRQSPSHPHCYPCWIFERRLGNRTTRGKVCHYRAAYSTTARDA